MAKNNTKGDRAKVILRDASEPFTVQLQEDYSLTRAQFEAQVNVKIKGRRKWYYTAVTVTGFEVGILRLRIKTYGESHRVIICVADRQLQLSCDCGHRVKQLCIHAVKVMEHLLYQGPHYFQQYRPAGWVENCRAHPELFTEEVEDSQIIFSSKKGVGPIQWVNEKRSPDQLKRAFRPPGNLSPPQRDLPVRASMIMYPYSSRYETPPFLLPCPGKEYAKGNGIRSFYSYDRSVIEQIPHLAQPNGWLNRMCWEMWQQTEGTCRLFQHNTEKDQKRLNKLFGLWEEVWPLLHQQRYVYAIAYVWARDLKGHPNTAYTERVRIMKERPVVRFQLKDKDSYFQLIPKVEAGGKALSRFSAICPYFVHQDGAYYRLSSLRDGAVLEWIGQMNNRLGVLKEHFDDFERQFLNPLRGAYPVEMP